MHPEGVGDKNLCCESQPVYIYVFVPFASDAGHMFPVLHNDGSVEMSVRIGSELAVLTAFCILTMFLFPTMHGPYSVLHGPVTALQAARAAARLRAAIVKAALSILADQQISLFLPLASGMLSLEKFCAARRAQCSTILRC